MALLDVASITMDPMFASTFDVERFTDHVGDDGRASATPVPDVLAGLRGTVVPSSGSNRHTREAEATRGGRGIDIYTVHVLRDASLGYIPDVVIWRGDRYEVQTCDPYADFGQGFYHITAISKPLSVSPIP